MDAYVFFRSVEIPLDIVVGWNDTLQTFFAEIWELRPMGVERACLRFVMGTEVNEITDVALLDFLLGTFGGIPDEITRRLRCDQFERTLPTLTQIRFPN